ncbi:MAG: peptide chain release factor N(5)-glutamine methyltransferase [Bacteroidales bacterium]|nr:peptide chain release factor N(5)-glutamine methyltransferase [Bacteroidales bacterium]
MTWRELYNIYTQKLSQIYDEKEANSQALIALCHVGNFNKVNWLLEQNNIVSSQEKENALNILKRLQTQEPIQYILGETDFYGLKLKLNNSVLIPRPETEFLTDIIIKENKNQENLKIIDIGTGSGCIAISIAKFINNSRVYALDISDSALKIAEQNAKLNNCDVQFSKFDVFKDDLNKISKNTDIIVSNPPYVFESDKKLMQNNVLNFEPHSALFVPSNNPLMFYKVIAQKASLNLKNNGKLYFEIHEKTGNAIVSLLEDYGFNNINLIEDFNKKHRFVSAIK